MKSCPECAATFPDDYAICPKDGAPLHETTLWQTGTVVRGKYRIQARLGEGGMAVVYKAHHELLDELRALKVIKPDLARDNEFVSRFKNEAIMARRLNHPNAVRVDDLDIAEDGLPFIAMELVVGDTLLTLLEQTGSLPVTLVLDVSLHVCEALDAAHKLGLVHRDIKPENIVLVAQREGAPVPKILDFGISRLLEETTAAKGLTQTGVAIGTPEYMSPEQILGKRGHEIDGRSDLYSLGVVMYRMLTGELPFSADTTVDMVLQHLKTPPKPPHVLKPGLGIPEAVSAIVMKALEKDRRRRFATGAEMAAAIRRVRKASTSPAVGKIELEPFGRPEAIPGAEAAAPTPPVDRIPATPRPVTPASTAPPAAPPRPVTPVPAAPPPAPISPPIERPLYRSSARLGPPRRELPTRLLLALAVVVVVVGGAFAGWKYSKLWRSTGGTRAAEPARTPQLSSVGATKTVETPRSGPAVPVPRGQPKAGRKTLSYEEQAKVVELNSLAAIYYREGGCLKALPVYQQVMEIDPTNPRAYTAIEKCYAKARNGANISLPPSTSPDSPNP